ncbi:phage holin family protein [Roseimaritima sediminicola]|uniref:phage holin family protein n=1 Tax=Roseimaritima sediminicola TaxID=2662066 RepID=UPI00129831ED|nr:phage holin family protein [Roseimaritima sediminicola]
MNNESGFKRVARDVSDLFELQMQLFAVDSQEAVRKVVKASVLLGIAAVIGLSVVTVLILAAGWGIHEVAEWPLSVSMLTSAVVFLLVAGILGWVGVTALKRALALLDEPKRELAENLRWIKATLLAPDTSPRNLLRRESFHSRFQVSSDR